MFNPKYSVSSHKINRFSGWSLDDDVENTYSQNQEASSPGIPTTPSPPPRPPRQASCQQASQPQTHNLFTEDNICPPIWDNPTIPNWGLPPLEDWSVGWESNTTPPVPTTSVSKDAPVEHVTAPPRFNSDCYRGDLDTHRFNHPTEGIIHYITPEDVFEYITLGRYISDSFLDELTAYVVAEVPTKLTRTRDETTFHGRVYERDIPLYSWEQYGLVARSCIEWSLSNPEKLSR